MNGRAPAQPASMHPASMAVSDHSGPHVCCCFLALATPAWSYPQLWGWNIALGLSTPIATWCFAVNEIVPKVLELEQRQHEIYFSSTSCSEALAVLNATLQIFANAALCVLRVTTALPLERRKCIESPLSLQRAVRPQPRLPPMIPPC